MKVFLLLLILTSQTLSSSIFRNPEVSPATTAESDDRSVTATKDSQHACRLCNVKNKDPRIILSHLHDHHPKAYLKDFYRLQTNIDVAENPENVFSAADGPQIPCNYCQFLIPERYMPLHHTWYHSDLCRNLLLRRLGRPHSIEPAPANPPKCKITAIKAVRPTKPKPKLSPKVKPVPRNEPKPQQPIPTIDTSFDASFFDSDYDETVEQAILESIK